MGFFDFLKLRTLEQEHDETPKLCFPHLQWETDDENDGQWVLRCSACHHRRGYTFFDQETGQRRLHWQTYFPGGCEGKPNSAYPEYDIPLRKILLEKFPDADEPNAEHAAIEQAAFEARIAQYEAEDEVRRQENLSKPHCPTCNSTDVQKISNAKRIASTAVMGIASSTIGKSYECKKCGYKW